MISEYNLAQSLAEQRARLLRVTSYDITLDVADGASASEETFRSTTTVRFDCTEPGAQTVIEVAAAKLAEVTLNGAAVDTTEWSSETGLPLTGLAATNVLTVTGEFGYASGTRGLYRVGDPADGQPYLYTSFEPAAAQRVFACFDQPDLKAEFTWQVRVPRGWRAISNMPVVGQDVDGDGDGDGGGGSVTMIQFATSPRMSTYVTAICAGPYVEVRSTEGGRDLGIFCRPSLLEHLDAGEVFDLTRRGMDFYEQQFGQPYPLPKYDHVAVPEYPGAMENFGCIVFSERHLIFRATPTEADLLLRGMIILHELAHMWFGDLVTLQWWDDLWLNEAFATWASFWCLTEATRFTDAWASFAIQRKASGVRADQRSTTHPVYTQIPDVAAIEANFDAITYSKGASILKQLAAYVGIDAFTAGLRTYFATHTWGNATFSNLVGALAAASGRPVRDFADQWLRTAQVNTLRPELAIDDNGRYRTIAIEQSAPADHPALRTHHIAVGLYDLDQGRLVRRDRVELEVSGVRTEVPALCGVPAADVLLLNDDDFTFAKLRLDERSIATVLEHIGGFDSALPRSLCWAAAADMVNDAELASRDFIALVCNGLAAERDTALVAAVLEDATRAVNYFADPAWAPTGWAMLAETCRGSAYGAEPGGSLQLTWARGFASTARTDADLACLKAWFSGTDLPDGLRLDANLRWVILQGLVAFSAAGTDEIDREAAADQSVDGQREAAQARALIPTSESKRQAWQTLLDGGKSFDVRLGTLFGYSHPAHTRFTGSHVDDYLSAVDPVWHEQGNEAGRYFALLAFPKAHVSAETIAAADAWLATGDHPSTVARSVRDGRDELVRALAGRAYDAERHLQRRSE